LLLGCAEASFVPCALFLVGRWVPESRRGGFIACFWISTSIAAIAGAPLSTYILTFDRILGLQSWQMLFVAEAAPLCVIGLVGYWLLHDDPAKASWLNNEERTWLIENHAAEKDAPGRPARAMLLAFRNPRILMLSLAYFLLMTMGISFSFFLPLYLHSRAIAVATIGSGVAVVQLMGAVGHIVWGRWSDNFLKNRQLVCCVGALTSAIALFVLPFASGVSPILLAAGVVQMGLCGAMTSYWPLPMAAARGSGAAGLIAGITMLGNATGLIGPYVTGALRDQTGSYLASFTVLAACMALSGLLVLLSRRFVASAPIERIVSPGVV
jgi:MFS transporter, ACS family, tartrate transporter